MNTATVWLLVLLSSQQRMPLVVVETFPSAAACEDVKKQLMWGTYGESEARVRCVKATVARVRP